MKSIVTQFSQLPLRYQPPGNSCYKSNSEFIFPIQKFKIALEIGKLINIKHAVKVL